MKGQKLHSVYFVGIGGIGMSALARYYKAQGASVYGYDRVCTELTKQLESEGLEITYDADPAMIPASFLDVPMQQTLVVLTPAVPATHAGLGFLRSRGYEVKKRSEVLASLIGHLQTIAIAGTHGKTTTIAMVAHLLNSGGVPCNAFLGGVANNFNSNLLLHPNAKYAVVEADEYDRSFLRLDPLIAVITSVDADHLDIYGDASAMSDAFHEFANKVNPAGKLISHVGFDIQSHSRKQSYGLSENADISAQNIVIENGAYHFDIIQNGKTLGVIKSKYPGHHNVENAVAAIAVALEVGMDWQSIQQGVETFSGVKRRFEYHINREDLVYIDDYAHHPTEISACVGSVKELYPNKRITGVFQPHLYSRTRDFMDDFAQSLESLNELLLMEIYPAREEPIPGVESSALLNKIRMVNKKLCERENLVDEVLSLDPEVLLTMGAGDIDKMIAPLKTALNQKYE